MKLEEADNPSPPLQHDLSALIGVLIREETDGWRDNSATLAEKFEGAPMGLQNSYRTMGLVKRLK